MQKTTEQPSLNIPDPSQSTKMTPVTVSTQLTVSLNILSLYFTFFSLYFKADMKIFSSSAELKFPTPNLLV